MQDTYGKACYHLERAEYWQAQAGEHEAEALQKATQQVKGRMNRSNGMEIDPSYVADTLLRDHHGYAVACGNRNAHQRQAEIYMLAHLAGIGWTPWDRTVNGLVKAES